MEYATLINELITQQNFSFGEPWRFSEKSLAIVVPIISKQKGVRDYYVIEEVRDKIQLTDTGSIDGVKAKSNADKPVFIRSGSEFGAKGGIGTQERSLTVGTVLFPTKEELLQTVCIHASRGIAAGAFFGYSGLVPQTIHSAVAKRNQSATWKAVNNYTQDVKCLMRASNNASGFTASLEQNRLVASPMDDLVGFQHKAEEVQEFKEQIENFLSKIPADLKGQVGIVVLDLNGVVGLEIFDHTDSWKAFSKSVAKSYKEVLMKEKETSDMFELKQERVVDHIIDFLASLRGVAQKAIWQKADAYTKNGKADIHVDAVTYQIETDKIIGEYTALPATNVIHLIITRKTEETRGTDYITSRLAWETIMPREQTPQEQYPQTPIYTTTMQELDLGRFLKKKGSNKFLFSLTEQPQTWGNLQNQVDVSTRTLSNLAKAAQSLGLVQKDLRHSNGHVVYKLTEKGEKAVAYES